MCVDAGIFACINSFGWWPAHSSMASPVADALTELPTGSRHAALCLVAIGQAHVLTTAPHAPGATHLQLLMQLVHHDDAAVAGICFFMPLHASASHNDFSMN